MREMHGENPDVRPFNEVTWVFVQNWSHDRGKEDGRPVRSYRTDTLEKQRIPSWTADQLSVSSPAQSPLGPSRSLRCEGLYWTEPKASRFAWYVWLRRS